MAEADSNGGAVLSPSIGQLLERFESQRLECARKVKARCGIVAGLTAVAVAIALAARAEPAILLFIAIAGAGVGYAVYGAATSGYRKAYKSEVVGSVVAAYLDGLRYRPEGTIARRQFEWSGLYTQGIDRYRGEDYIEGTLDKTEFAFSEVHAEYKITTTDSKGRRRTSWRTIFKGIFFIADFHKDFRARTVVLPDTAQRLFGSFGQTLQSFSGGRGELVKLEDPEFEREFCVYGDDQVEARYILSPSLMRRILDYKRKFRSDMRLAFRDSKVFVALSCDKNRFEPRVFESIADGALIAEYRADLDLIIGIVNDLNLNTRVWSKE